MKKMHQIIVLILLTTLFAQSVYTQECDYMGYDQGASAYTDCCYSTRWTAYIPIVTLVLAALVLSRADKPDKKGHGCHHHTHSGSSCGSSYYFPYSCSSYTGATCYTGYGH